MTRDQDLNARIVATIEAAKADPLNRWRWACEAAERARGARALGVEKAALAEAREFVHGILSGRAAR